MHGFTSWLLKAITKYQGYGSSAVRTYRWSKAKIRSNNSVASVSKENQQGPSSGRKSVFYVLRPWKYSWRQQECGLFSKKFLATGGCYEKAFGNCCYGHDLGYCAQWLRYFYFWGIMLVILSSLVLIFLTGLWKYHCPFVLLVIPFLVIGYVVQLQQICFEIAFYPVLTMK